MIILSIDVGIKNLAVCCFEVDCQNKTQNIIDWDVHDLCGQNNFKCLFETKNGKKCNKNAKYIKNDLYCCKTHANSSKYFIPTSEMNIKNLKKKRISELYVLAKSYNIEHEDKIGKSELLKLFEDHIKDNYFDIIAPVKIDDIHMITMGRNINRIFTEKYKKLNIDLVLIENQISPIANKMKTIQGMIAQYFIMSSLSEIEFISSINKLKDFENCKNLSYKERKSKSIEICRHEISSSDPDFVSVFDNSNKKDDLSDSYLQGIWYIKNKIFI